MLQILRRYCRAVRLHRHHLRRGGSPCETRQRPRQRRPHAAVSCHRPSLPSCAAIASGAGQSPVRHRCGDPSASWAWRCSPGDLACCALIPATRLFPMAAPTGGMVMIGGWALLALAAFLSPAVLSRPLPAFHGRRLKGRPLHRNGPARHFEIADQGRLQ